MKITCFTCKDTEGQKYIWSFWYESTAYSTDNRRWMLKDHDGYVRVLEKTWIDSLPRMQIIIENYGFTSSLS